ncbi:MAG: hypothetical protein IKC78_07715 [Alistipes sp.]|nr:hypothetical protein [Alistipes sp.]
MSFPIFASSASGDNTTPYAKMSGINRLITALQRTAKNSPSKARGSTRRGGSVSLPQSHFLQRGVLQGRFHHFFILAIYLHRPSPMKKCGMTQSYDCFIIILHQTNHKKVFKT